MVLDADTPCHVPSGMRFLRVYVHENGGSMPLEALSAKARLMVPVGAIESRCELRMPCCRICSLISAGRREAKLPPREVEIGVEHRERAALLRELDRGSIRAVAHRLARFSRAIARASAVS